MRSVLFVWLALALAPAGAIADTVPALPPGAEALEAKLLTRVGPETRAWIRREAALEAAAEAPSEARVRQAIARHRPLGDLQADDVGALAFLVMMQAAKSAREDLKAIMDGVKAIDGARGSPRDQARRARTAVRRRPPDPPPDRRPLPRAELDARLERLKGDAEALGALRETESLRLQSAQDHTGRLISLVSNLQGRLSEAAAELTRNLE